MTEKEKAIVYDGPAEKKHILYRPKNSEQATELDFTYFNAVYTVENALAKVKDEKGMKRVEKFLKQDICPDCGGTRLSEAARAPKLRGISLDQACEMTLARADQMGHRGSCLSPGRNETYGRKYLSVFSGSCKTADGSGSGLSHS